MNRIKRLPVGIATRNGYIRDIEILKSNGVAEKVFTDKLPEKPYTWMGNVLAASIKEIGGETIAEKCRAEYFDTRSITIPNALLSMSIADVHTALLEVHRTAWKPVLKKQEALCKYCGTKMITDVDLTKIKMPDYEEKEWHELTCDLEDGYVFKAFGKPTDEVRMFDEYDGITFNRMVFKIPTLRDAINNEEFSDDSVTFWRKIAYTTLSKFEAVEDGEVVAELPREAIIAVGMKLFDLHLYSDDLFIIRDTLREKLPIMPYYYQAECVNTSCKRLTPISMESGSFFSD